jgi:hypothetical protein
MVSNHQSRRKAGHTVNANNQSTTLPMRTPHYLMNWHDIRWNKKSWIDNTGNDMAGYDMTWYHKTYRSSSADCISDSLTATLLLLISSVTLDCIIFKSLYTADWIVESWSSRSYSVVCMTSNICIFDRSKIIYRSMLIMKLVVENSFPSLWGLGSGTLRSVLIRAAL